MVERHPILPPGPVKTASSAEETLRGIARLLKAQNWRAAEAACAALVAERPGLGPAWHLHSIVALHQGQHGLALDRADRAVGIQPLEPRLHLHRAQCLAACNQWQQAFAAADRAKQLAPDDAGTWDAIGSLYSYGDQQARACEAYDRAVHLAPDNPAVLFNRAAVRRFLGQLAEAETDYDRVIQLRPHDYEAYKNRSELRTQSLTRNHIAELLERLRGDSPAARDEVFLRYALAKEYEDIGEYATAFEHLRRGAELRRQNLGYDVSGDVETVAWIMEAFPGSAAAVGNNAAAPIFIVGLPRSGSTLVDRILSSHSQVVSAGEMNHFATSIVDAVRRESGAAVLTRRDMVRRSATLDYEALGQDYLQRTGKAGTCEPRFTDKMPLNYLYCALIHRALPRAKIVHVTREPMAACFAMYKTLFNAGYPFSYDFDDIARYYTGYRRLMDHWHKTLPGVIYRLNYEVLVADPAREIRKLLAHCDLPWEDACAEPHRNTAPTTTASAAQVRRPIYDTSVAQWRHYEKTLTSLRAKLQSAGFIDSQAEG